MSASSWRRIVLLFLSCCAVGRPAVAEPQGAAAVDTVEALVARALAQAPSLAAQRARVEAAQSSERAAGALPNPMLEFEYRDFNFPRYTIGSDPMSMAGVGIRQSLLSTGRRSAERGVARAEIGRRQAEQRVATTDLATAVRLQYARLFALDRERETLTNAQELVALLEATVTTRYGAGQADQASVLRVQLERTRLGQRLLDLNTERFAVQSSLNRLTNDPPDRPIATVAELPDTSLPASIAAETSAESLASHAPEVMARQRNVEMAASQVNAARQELRPSWSVGGGLYWQGGTDRTVTFNVGVELPFRKDQRVRPLIAAAELEQRAAQLDLQNTSAEVRAEQARLATEWRAATEQIERYKTAILPQNSAAFDATRSSYLAGRGDFVSVLEEFRRWIDVRTELATREANRYSAAARLDALVGGTR